ncbi:hypothetical protein [Burkholderia cepacia]|uniref:hypothetical protein n=1 Tax=Burkholderia cepacia TaxID=292 RepID=UPI0002E71E1A|nr:hypothetical protein [Burkholderia cepacia]
MTKFFDKALADEIGYGMAIAVAGMASDLLADIDRMHAVRKTNGHPALEQEEESDRAWFREQMEAGERFDPDVEAWARGE